MGRQNPRNHYDELVYVTYGNTQSPAHILNCFSGLPLPKMALPLVISAIMFAAVPVLPVEGTAKGAVPLDTLTFDKVFLKWL